MSPLDRFAGGPPLGGAPRLALCFASRLSRIFSLALRPVCIRLIGQCLACEVVPTPPEGREARHHQCGCQVSSECLLRRAPALLGLLTCDIRCVAIETSDGPTVAPVREGKAWNVVSTPRGGS